MGVGPLSDVYSYAMLCYELWTLEWPMKDMGRLAVIKAVCDGYRPPLLAVPDSIMKMLIQSCWAQHYADRPSFDEIQPQLQALCAANPASKHHVRAVEDLLLD